MHDRDKSLVGADRIGEIESNSKDPSRTLPKIEEARQGFGSWNPPGD
jgi:hypothetical protein